MKDYPLIIDRDTQSKENHEIISAITYMVPECSKVLDCGCNSGWLMEELIKKQCSVIGIDNSPVVINVARNKGLDVLLADAQEMPFADGLFDVVTLVTVLQQMTKQEANKTLQECKRVLNKTGVIIGASATPTGGWGIKNLGRSPYVHSVWDGSLFTRSIGLTDDTYLFVELREDIDKLIEVNY